jgi:hypothetical protein
MTLKIKGELEIDRERGGQMRKPQRPLSCKHCNLQFCKGCLYEGLKGA